MQIIMTGQATPAQIGGYLVALRMKGETVDEITGSRGRCAPRPAACRYPTAAAAGYRRHRRRWAHTFNISTAAAFVIAGAGGRSPSTATGRLLRAAAAPMCWARWA
jgi:anthranilate phosphoribosyltransferase